MATPLTADEETRYTEVIDGILATADLETVTRKKIRMGLEAALGGKDLSDQKNAIKALIEERFDAISSAVPPPSSAAPKTESASPRPSSKRQADNYDENGSIEEDVNGGEIKVSVAPPKKKQRKDKGEDVEDADAKLAALLQAQENQRTRATRGGGKPKAPVKKKKKATPRKKSDKKVGPDDDSDVEGSEGSGSRRRKAIGGFQKPFNLSYPLAELCGEAQLSRPQVVKKLWEHIKGNQLQDPNDGRQIRCDERMQAVFKQARVDMFQMNKLVGNHLYPVDEE
ncbi:SWIB-domain-containing protein [Hypoxylon fragiforme]|uniref:SWIB-domain-containing protein n=1 Tax=Hypoxylon fragiforme TaxID=63214 RepID=UPI0020C5C9A6|nr:SWIB-domain-containing protein [Hypoxylon fragiforme]KAI2613478.1 SWIB-domain-containing protein [Hypoxylon fragiforme]